MPNFILCYSKGSKDELLKSLKKMGAQTKDLGFNNLLVRHDGSVEDLKAIKGVSAVEEEGQKKPS